MKKAIKEKWVKALRSGKYKQTRCTLARRYRTNEQRFCCLGVLCSIYSEEKGGKFVKADGGKNGALAFETPDESSFLPEKVMKWAGLKENNPVVKTGRTNIWERPEEESLSNLNDDLKWNFNKIADIIEKEL